MKKEIEVECGKCGKKLSVRTVDLAIDEGTLVTCSCGWGKDIVLEKRIEENESRYQTGETTKVGDYIEYYPLPMASCSYDCGLRGVVEKILSDNGIEIRVEVKWNERDIRSETKAKTVEITDCKLLKRGE